MATSAESERVAGFGRLEDALLQVGESYQSGPYVSERQCARSEDYSADGNAWDSLPHDHARAAGLPVREDGHSTIMMLVPALRRRPAR